MSWWSSVSAVTGTDGGGPGGNPGFGVAGTTNRGGGGGGGSQTNGGGNGGSGIVIARYITEDIISVPTPVID